MWVTYDKALIVARQYGMTERKLDKAIMRGVVISRVDKGIIYIKQSSLKNLIK